MNMFMRMVGVSDESYLMSKNIENTYFFRYILSIICGQMMLDKYLIPKLYVNCASVEMHAAFQVI